jgi:hypothetical protein
VPAIPDAIKQNLQTLSLQMRVARETSHRKELHEFDLSGSEEGPVKGFFVRCYENSRVVVRCYENSPVAQLL